MTELINIITNEQGKKLVSARELYFGLGLNESHWSKWYKKNIVENEFFFEKKDWMGFSTKGENSQGGRPTQDFAISLDFAKHIAMMAKTKKSHEYRNYFIACEDKLKEIVKPALPSYTEALRQLADRIDENEKLKGEKKKLEEEGKQKGGIITPLIVAPDMTVVSGHQRLKASKDLGVTKVPIIIRDDLDDEEEKLKKLLATNFGRVKNDPNKMRKVAVEYVELCGNKHGGNRASSDNRNLTLEEMAKGLGISKTTLTELLEIERKLTPEVKELLDSGLISKISASKIWVKLSGKEQMELLEELGKGST
ncbi:antA/AntB antirepressor family protein [Clostridium chromiireducens]|uniref:antA/AntB antirepressor family protein n=1 Tax=Clostridium chromiireducens TaxID=225345 RepID=UPI003AF62963